MTTVGSARDRGITVPGPFEPLVAGGKTIASEGCWLIRRAHRSRGTAGVATRDSGIVSEATIGVSSRCGRRGGCGASVGPPRVDVLRG